MHLTRPITFQTPGKVNFFLNILSKREDGFHELLMDLHPVSLFDTITLSPAADNQTTFSCNRKDLQSSDNILLKACELLSKSAGESIIIGIHLEKRLPVGGGVGGGSGNAAGLLVVLNRELGLGLTTEKLQELALQLGSDVPFFISPQPSLARGRGEKLEPLSDAQSLPLLLLQPPFSISTGEAYRNCAISGRTSILEKYDPDYLRGELTPDRNDFWKFCLSHYPAISSYRELLLKSGAVASGLSGSGSTVFAVYSSQEQRDHALETLLPQPSDFNLFPCETLQSYDYERLS